MSTLVKTQGLTKHYRQVDALVDVDLEIPSGKIIGLVGPNGAGKTTLLRALTGQLEYDGKVRVLDLEPYSKRNELMESTGVIHDVAVLPEWMRVEQLLDFMESMHPGFDRSKAMKYLKRTSIPLTQKVKNLSKGMKTQLHLSVILATDSRLLILDEPTHGLDILFRKQLYTTVLEDYFDEEKSILISTHQIEEVEHILSDVIFIKDGRILLQDSMESLTERYRQVSVASEKMEEFEKAVKTLTQTRVLGRSICLVQDVDEEILKEYGDVQAPSVADIFVALMGEPHSSTGGAA